MAFLLSVAAAGPLKYFLSSLRVNDLCQSTVAVSLPTLKEVWLWSSHPYRPCSILRRFIVSVLWQHEIVYRFSSSNFNFGRDWIFFFFLSFFLFNELGWTSTARPAWKAGKHRDCVTRRSECAKQRAPVIHPQFPDGAQVEEERKQPLRTDGGNE